MMISLAVACISLLTRHQAAQVDLVSLDTIDSVGGILGAVSKTIGQRIVVDLDVAAINAYVRVDHVAWDDLKRHLADMTRATWSERGGTLSLKRTPQRTRRIAEERAAALTSLLTEELAKLQPGLSQDAMAAAHEYAKTLRAEIAKKEPLQFIGPNDGLLHELLRSIGAHRLAELPAYKILVFSNEPTSPEVGLPDASELVQRFKDVSQAFANEVTEESMQGVLGRDEYDRIVGAAHKTDSVGRIVITVSRSSRELFAIMHVYDLQGRNLTYATCNLPLGLIDEEVKLSNGQNRIGWPDRTKAALAILRRTNEASGGEQILNPFMHEPLQLQAVPALQSIAGEQAPNILCPLPDRVVLALYQAAPERVGDAATVFDRAGVTLQIKNDWLLGGLRPTFFDPYQYLSRPVLGSWVDAAPASSQTWLRRTSTFYAQGGDAVSNGLPRWIQDTFWPILKIKETSQMTPRWALFALGTFTDSEWDDFEQGRPVPASAPFDRRNAIEQWSWQSPIALEPFGDAQVKDTERIGSFSFPGGPPDTAVIRLNKGSERVIGITIKGTLYWMALDQAANWVCEATHPRPTTEDGAIKAMKGRYRLGLRPGGQIVAVLSSRLGIHCDQPYGDVVVTGDSVAINDWPADILQQFRAAIRDYLAERGAAGAPPPW